MKIFNCQIVKGEIVDMYGSGVGEAPQYLLLVEDNEHEGLDIEPSKIIYLTEDLADDVKDIHYQIIDAMIDMLSETEVNNIRINNSESAIVIGGAEITRRKSIL